MRPADAALVAATDSEVVGVEFDGAAAIDAAVRLSPDVVLLDLSCLWSGGKQHPITPPGHATGDESR